MKTRVPGQKPLRTERKSNKVSPHVTTGHAGNQTPAILVEGECHSKNDDENENDYSNDMKQHDLAMLLLPHRFVEHEQAFAPFTCIHIARTRVQVTDYNFLLQWKNAKRFWSKIIFQGH